jgi:hypothetical protein
MKPLKRFLFFIAGICLLLSCSKSSDQLNPALSGLSADDKKGHGFGCGEVFVVKPNGTDDTWPLQQAFEDAIKAGPGSVVKLVKGNYNIGSIEIREFNGSFVGEGKEKTIITSKTGLNAGLFQSEGSNWFLIKFIGGDIKMSGMTIQTPPGSLIDEVYTLMGLLLFSDFGPQYESETGHIKAVIDNINFIGQPCWDTWYNAPYALSACNDNNFWDGYSGLPHSNIDIKVTNCSFNTFWEGVFIYGAEGNLTVGTKNNGNIFSNTFEHIGFYENINADITALSNTLNITAYGISIDNFPNGPFDNELQNRTTTCNIENNIFNIGYFGLWLHDHRIVSYPEEKRPMLMQVKNNQFNMLADGSLGGEMIEGVNAVICNNKFTGTGASGFYADALNGVGVWSENCLFLGNNFSTCTLSDYAIKLGSFTRNFKVIGNGKDAVIIDEGVNNIIKDMNVKHSDHHEGHNDIVDNHQHKMREEMIHRHKK